MSVLLLVAMNPARTGRLGYFLPVILINLGKRGVRARHEAGRSSSNLLNYNGGFHTNENSRCIKLTSSSKKGTIHCINNYSFVQSFLVEKSCLDQRFPKEFKKT